MIVDKTITVCLDPVKEFDDVIKFEKDSRWRRTSTTSVLVTYESTEYGFQATVEDLLKKEQ